MTQNNINAIALALVGHESPGTRGTCTPSTCSATSTLERLIGKEINMYNSRVFTGNRNSDYFCITFLYSLTPPIKRVPYSPPLLYQNVHCIITVVLKTSLLSLTPTPPFHR